MNSIQSCFHFFVGAQKVIIDTKSVKIGKNFLRHHLRHARQLFILINLQKFERTNLNMLARTKRNERDGPDPGKGFDQR